MSTSSTDRVLAAVLVLAAGCNGLLGLDATVTDSDGDGIPDDRDNCPLQANPNQLDGNLDGIGNACQCISIGSDLDSDGIDDGCDDCIGDGPIGADSNDDGVDDGCEACPMGHGDDRDDDGIDDACDPCTSGPPHDEDGDGIADACDNCPTVANADQANADSDVLGDACDLVGSQQRRVIDGFAFEDPTLWTGVVPGWSWDNDALSAMPVAALTPRRYSRLSMVGNAVAETRATPPPGGHASLEVHGHGIHVCMLDDARMVSVSYALSGGTPPIVLDMKGPVPGSGRIRLRLFADAAAHFVYCEGIDEGGEAATAMVPNTDAPQGRVALASGDGTTVFEFLFVSSE